MTGPVPFNPYGVSTPYGHPGEAGSTRQRADHPLVPWREDAHEKQWVDVDCAREQIETFDRSLDLGEVLDRSAGRGRVVIVSGPQGMGKTTLIHRCIHEVQRRIARYSTEHRPTVIVATPAGLENDGSGISVDENGDFAPAAIINARIRADIEKRLHGHEFPELRTAELKELDDPYQAYEATADLLDQQNALLLAVVPHIRWNDAALKSHFLRTCVSNARSRIVLFVELGHGAAEAAQVVPGNIAELRGVTHLTLGELHTEDIWKFSQSGGKGHPEPGVTIESDRADLEQAHELWKPADVREIRQVFHDAAPELWTSETTLRVTATQLRRHWKRRRPGTHNMGRTLTDT